MAIDILSELLVTSMSTIETRKVQTRQLASWINLIFRLRIRNFDCAEDSYEDKDDWASYTNHLVGCRSNERKDEDEGVWGWGRLGVRGWGGGGGVRVSEQVSTYPNNMKYRRLWNLESHPHPTPPPHPPHRPEKFNLSPKWWAFPL